MGTNDLELTDVTVVGGGMAGMAVCIHLARAGLRVCCVEAKREDRQIVGESLDWSAPALLKTLGLPMEDLISRNMATYKKHVTLIAENEETHQYIPGEWLSRPPYSVELKTIHVDRFLLDSALREIMLGHGVQMLNDKAATVECAGDRISAVVTASGRRLTSRWFVDASGLGTSLFARSFKLGARKFGPRKVAVWTYFDVAEAIEGTTLYTSAGGGQPRYMEWTWQIPVRNDLISVGFITTGEAIKKARQQGRSLEDVLNRQFSRFGRLERLTQQTPAKPVRATSFQCRVHERIAGLNWLVIGEAASMVDPMTSNGVTAALRQAEEAAALIVATRGRTKLPLLRRAMFSRRTSDLGNFFNCGIEKVIYDGPIRSRIGTLNAGDVYTIPAWLLNHLYSRFQPKGLLMTGLFSIVLNLFQAAAIGYYQYCKLLTRAPKAGSEAEANG